LVIFNAIFFKLVVAYFFGPPCRLSLTPKNVSPVPTKKAGAVTAPNLVFFCFQSRFIIYVDFTRIAASNTATDNVTN